MSQFVRRLLVAAAVLALVTSIAVDAMHERPAAAESRPTQPGSALGFDSEGHLLRPTGYREWIYVGTPLTPNDMNHPQAAFPEFHSVYIHPDAYRAYRKTGAFPDRTAIVKELASVGSKQASSGNGYFMGEFTGLEVAIKDQTRFADEPGNWAYFSFGHAYPLAHTAQAQATTSCNTCHATANEDYVFTQYYPVLRAAKPSEPASP
ncbi:MAG: cytochrome P460 [Planctomycetota bacterium]|nr:MAG: cytochrome P460 [Planctomycetota bacterium]